ncbi:MAG: hypothetical protein GX057_04695 [Clostridiales bacterium]|nr:hypothetical protein [Clostridiales bacterium]
MQTPRDPQLRRKLIASMVLWVAVIFFVYSVLLNILYIKTTTDIAFMIPVLADIVPYAFDLTEICGILLGWAFIIFSAFKFDIKSAWGFVAVSMLLTMYKYIMKILTAYAMEGKALFADDIFNFLMANLAVPALIEFLLLAILLFIIYLVYRKVSSHVRFQKELEARLPNYNFDERALFFPIKKLFDKNNPLQKTIAWMSGVFALFRIEYLIMLDVQIGPPTDLTDLFWMIFNYLTALLLGFCAYLFMLYVMILLNSKDFIVGENSGQTGI